jgi:hypothetical protein
VGPRAGLDDVKKRKLLSLPGLEVGHLCRPARSQSLYGGNEKYNTTLVTKPEGKRVLGRPRMGGRVVLQLMLQKCAVDMWTSSGWRPLF